jgi:hypothetical protein
MPLVLICSFVASRAVSHGTQRTVRYETLDHNKASVLEVMVSLLPPACLSLIPPADGGDCSVGRPYAVTALHPLCACRVNGVDNPCS